MTTRLMGLAVLLLVALLPVAQGVAATSFEAEPMAEACVMLPDTQVMHVFTVATPEWIRHSVRRSRMHSLEAAVIGWLK